eukprot:sb/3463067/
MICRSLIYRDAREKGVCPVNRGARYIGVKDRHFPHRGKFTLTVNRGSGKSGHGKSGPDCIDKHASFSNAVLLLDFVQSKTDHVFVQMTYTIIYSTEELNNELSSLLLKGSPEAEGGRASKLVQQLYENYVEESQASFSRDTPTTVPNTSTRVPNTATRVPNTATRVPNTSTRVPKTTNRFLEIVDDSIEKQRCLVQKQLDSDTIIDSFSRLIRRCTEDTLVYDVNNHQTNFLYDYCGKMNMQKEWRENGVFRHEWNKWIGKYDIDNLSVVFAQYISSYLSEEVMDASNYYDWALVMTSVMFFVRSKDKDFVKDVSVAIVDAGIPSLIAKLFGADFSEGRHQTEIYSVSSHISVNNLLGCFCFLITFQQPEADQPYTKSHNEAFDLVITNIVEKFVDKRYNLVVLRSLAFEILPKIVVMRATGFESSPGELAPSLRIIYDNMDTMMPFLDIRTFLDILYTSIRLPKSTEEKFLQIMKQNLSSPFYQPRAKRVPDYLKLTPRLFQINTDQDAFRFAATNYQDVTILINMIELDQNNPDHRNFYQTLESLVKTYLTPRTMITFGLDLKGHPVTFKELGNYFYAQRMFEDAAGVYVLQKTTVFGGSQNWYVPGTDRNRNTSP